MNETRQNRTSLSRAIILALILMIGGLNARAQYTVVLAGPVDAQTLSGHVKDPKGGKIEGAQVDLFDLQTETAITSTTTDSKGNFHFKDFGKDAYKLKIAKSGFKVLSATIRIRKHSPALAVFTLPIAA